MTEPQISVDDRGLRLTCVVDGSYDVFFDGQHVWSFSPRPSLPDEEDPSRFVRWPHTMRPWLDGFSELKVTCAGEELFCEELRFGSAESRIQFRDKDNIPVMIDKWGLLQRPFTGRGAGVVSHMVEVTEQILDVLIEECGVRAWIAFGTLLGAARGGKVIGHDSDIDLAYVSSKATPAEMAREMYAISRALRRAGMSVLNKSGSFITIMFPVPDGGTGSIDIYTCFYVGDLLHETATVRAPVPRRAVEPLTTLEFEGRPLPAPADPDALLTVSYGPGWRTPDPSFRHRPSTEITTRFDGWFGSVMRNRRDWERFLRERQDDEALVASDFSSWVSARLESEVHVVDLGTGNGRDALALAERGWSVTALDYARGGFRAAAEIADERELPVEFDSMNLYDLRDAMTRAAMLVRYKEEEKCAVYSRSLLEVLEPDGIDAFWRVVSMVLRGRGTAYLEFAPQPASMAGPAAGMAAGMAAGGKRFPMEPDSVERSAVAAGGRVITREARDEADGRRWRMAIEWLR